MKVNIDIPEDMLKVIDEKCEAEFFSRSEWIRTALRDKLFAKTGTMPVENTVIPSPLLKHFDVTPGWKPTTHVVDNSAIPTDKTKTITGTRYEVTATTLPMWCQGHFEQGVTHTCYKISYEDENGIEVLKDKWFCEKCVRGYMNRVGKVYGHLE